MVTRSLRHVESLTARIEQLGIERELTVSQALIAGATWSEIGWALGCSAQAAHKRYRWVRHSDRTGAVWHEPPLTT
ncbi:MAG: hypothetical protein ACRDYB_08845 [Acidimicrobiales bacterium]